MTDIFCDECKEELPNIFSGDEYDGQFLCSKCLKKTPLHIYKSIVIYEHQEITHCLNSDLELIERSHKTLDYDLSCSICENSFSVKRDKLEEKLREHYNFHLKDLDPKYQNQ